MTTREWHEADQDDADRVRAWPTRFGPSAVHWYVSLLIEKDEEIIALKAIIARMRGGVKP